MIRRVKQNKRYKYFSGDTEVIDKKRCALLEKALRHLRIPPGYTSVEVTPNSKTIIAKCLDTKNRKQYIYHPDFVNKQQKIKYCNLIDFGKKLPSIKRVLDRDMVGGDQKKN